MLPSRAVLQSSKATVPRVVIGPRALTPISARSYAQVAPTQSVKPPVALFGVDGTYASALYTAAAKNSTLESTARALSALHQIFQKDPKLSPILHAPSLSSSDKSQIVAELAKHTGGPDKGDTVKNFLKTLAENNRLGLLESICNKFETLMGAHRGEVEMNVTSASPLDPKILSRLETAVAKSQYVGPGKKLKVKNTVNPEIIGGLVVDVSGRTIDLSVSSRISKLNKLLSDAL
ncbi:MAG: ATP synthase F0 subcomplex subunit OSCP atp5 [Trizodia sp. TS-e1964]|nr:MAG: ATP synthase F0 subcomplex subunit OSCP atp5 [Trizodia sp. TS-e1964]